MPAPTKRRIMHELVIKEISAVDSPAQKGARAVILKRDDNVDPQDLVKRGKAFLTTSVDDHSHLGSLEDYEGNPVASGTTSWQASNSKRNNGHSHPWIMQEDGSILIGEADGHTHEVEATSKAAIIAKFAGAAMADGRYPIRSARDLENVVKAFEKAGDKPALAKHIESRAQALKLEQNLPTAGELAELLHKSPTGGTSMPTNEELSAQLATANGRVSILSKSIAALLALGASGVAYVSKLSETEREAFLGKGAVDQQAEIAKAAELNAVVFTAADGTEYRKNDDPRLVQMAKDRDADRAAIAKAERSNEDAAFTKRAETDLAPLSGATDVKVAVLRAIEKGEKVPDDKREAAAAMLKGAAEALKLSKSFGHRGPGTDPANEPGDSPVAKLDAMAKKHMADHKVDYSKAYSAVLETEEGRALYKRSTEGPGAGVH